MDAKKSTPKLTFLPDGDLELWYAEPPDKSWMLPLYVRWYKETQSGSIFGLVMQAVGFYHNQLLTIRTILEMHNIDSEHSDRWLIPKAMVYTKLIKAPGVTPSFYYRWTSEFPPLPLNWNPLSVHVDQPPPRRSEEFRSFADFISHERHIPADVVLIVLTAISQVGAKWLLNYRQAIDFGFVKLVAFPFRSNWKQIVAEKCKSISLLNILSLGGSRRRAILSQIGFPEMVSSLHNIGIKKAQENYRLEYTVEAITNDKFEKSCASTENAMHRAGSTSYVRHYEKSVEIHYENIIESMEVYLRKANLPFAKVFASSDGCILTFKPIGRTAKFKGIDLARLPVHIVENYSRFSVTQGESDPRLISAPPDEMPEVPVIPPPTDDVRGRGIGDDVEEPRTDGTSGVPVPHAGEGAAAGGPVLPLGSTF